MIQNSRIWEVFTVGWINLDFRREFLQLHKRIDRLYLRATSLGLLKDSKKSQNQEKCKRKNFLIFMVSIVNNKCYKFNSSPLGLAEWFVWESLTVRVSKNLYCCLQRWGEKLFQFLWQSEWEEVRNRGIRRASEMGQNSCDRMPRTNFNNKTIKCWFRKCFQSHLPNSPPPPPRPTHAHNLLLTSRNNFVSSFF